jgi:hypothetical protein
MPNTETPPTPAPEPVKVPPNTRSLWARPEYVPPPSTPVRPGENDHHAIKSRGE